MIDTLPAATFLSTIMEALACGTPAVEAIVGGIPEQIEDGVTGYLTLPDDDAVAARIVRLLEDEGLGQKMRGQRLKMRKRGLISGGR